MFTGVKTGTLRFRRLLSLFPSPGFCGHLLGPTAFLDVEVFTAPASLPGDVCFLQAIGGVTGVIGDSGNSAGHWAFHPEITGSCSAHMQYAIVHG
jgi:hypothetical protein